MDTSILSDLGLTNAEIKIYLAVLELGSTTAGPVLEKTGLQNSVVHMTLHKLVEKGFLSFVKRGKIRRYTATDPKNITNFIDEKKRRFETLLPDLLLKQKGTEKQEAEVYEGFKGLKAALYELIKDAKKGDEWLFFSFNTKNPEDHIQVFNFYKEFDNDRNKKGIVIKGIINKQISQLSYVNERPHANIIISDVPTILNTSIFKDMVLFTPWEDKQIAFLIRSKQLADSFRAYFYSIWDQHKSAQKIDSKPKSTSPEKKQ